LRDRVTRELGACRSPAAIAADLRVEAATVRVSTETIYRAVYAGDLEVRPVDFLRRRRSRQARHESKRPGLPNISTRPESINDRSAPGHWEGDLIIGARNQSASLTVIERKFRFGQVIDLPNGYTAPDVLAALSEAFEAIPAHLRCSLTLDQGSEWANWEILAATYSLKVFFCDPHSPPLSGQSCEYGQVRAA
jgi:IS30 family transposase